MPNFFSHRCLPNPRALSNGSSLKDSEKDSVPQRSILSRLAGHFNYSSGNIFSIHLILSLTENIDGIFSRAKTMPGVKYGPTYIIDITTFIFFVNINIF